jgi:DNA-binding response OmpR family regulator
MKTIAIIDRDTNEISILKERLEKEGFRVIHRENGQEALDIFLKERPDLFILEVRLPEFNGFEMHRMLRANPKFSTIPVIFLTECDSECDRLIGLELGAEDYITKPFYASEVIARIKNAFRAATAEASPILRAGMLEIDRRSRQVKIGEKQVALTATEYALLEFLMNNPGIVFARGQLLDAVWGNQRVVTERTVDVFMLRLRHKLGRLKEVKRVLNSVRGFGYRFDPEMVESSYAREKKVVYMHRVK